MLDVNAPFVHQWRPQYANGPQATSTLTLARAVELADAFEAINYTPYSTARYGSPEYEALKLAQGQDACYRVMAWTLLDIAATLANEPTGWERDVFDVLRARDDMRAQIAADARKAALIAEIEAFETTPAIRAHLLAAARGDVRGIRAPARVDMRWMIASAKRETSQFHSKRGPLTLDPSCPLRLRLGEAVTFTSTQESYADHTETLVPVTGELPTGAAIGACERNLATFVRRCDSHTGMAGSGTNYSASLKITPEGAFAIISGRHSIAD